MKGSSKNCFFTASPHPSPEGEGVGNRFFRTALNSKIIILRSFPPQKKKVRINGETTKL